MSSHERAQETPGNDEAAAAASSEPEVVDAEVVEEEVVDGEAGAEGEGHVAEAEAEVEVLEADPLADALRERAEYLELAQRTRADFENYKRRAATQAQEAEQRGRAAIARNLLPAIDNLQRALAAAGVDPADGDHADGMTKGFVLVYGELRSALERSGVNAFDPAGAKFDPMLHEAVSTAPAEGVEPGTVLETLELGYKVDEQVIRPARVVVSG
ncbi:MAG: nucleotide exchange factor GrpE [Solirubrobacterales bacterium]